MKVEKQIKNTGSTGCCKTECHRKEKENFQDRDTFLRVFPEYGLGRSSCSSFFDSEETEKHLVCL